MIKADKITGVGVETYVNPNGTVFHTLDGELHRVDGPAVAGANGLQFYFQYGKPHRMGGPAIIWPSGNIEYHINGECLHKQGPNHE
jgi:hypothetical protein